MLMLDVIWVAYSVLILLGYEGMSMLTNRQRLYKIHLLTKFNKKYTNLQIGTKVAY